MFCDLFVLVTIHLNQLSIVNGQMWILHHRRYKYVFLIWQIYGRAMRYQIPNVLDTIKIITQFPLVKVDLIYVRSHVKLPVLFSNRTFSRHNTRRSWWEITLHDDNSAIMLRETTPKGLVINRSPNHKAVGQGTARREHHCLCNKA